MISLSLSIPAIALRKTGEQTGIIRTGTTLHDASVMHETLRMTDNG